MIGKKGISRKTLFLSSLLIFAVLSLFFLVRYITTPKIRVFGTEYSPDDKARVFLQLLSDLFTPVTDAQCYVTIYDPQSNYFVKDQIMTHIEDGFYKYDFIAPNITGVYMVSVSCSYPNNLTTYYPTDVYYYNGGWVSFQPFYVYYDDEQYSPFNTTFRIDFNQVNEVPYIVLFKNAMSRGSSVSIYVYNYNTSSYDLFAVQDYYRPEISIIIENNSYLPPRIALQGTNRFYIDMCNIQIYHEASEYQTNIRGGGEVHIALKKMVISDIEIPEVRILD